MRVTLARFNPFLMKTVLFAFSALLASSMISIGEPQTGQFERVRTKATEMGNTAEGKVYEKRFSRAFAKPMDAALRDCVKDIKPPYTVNLVFIIEANGTIQSILPAPGELISEGIAIKLKNLKVPPPPKPGWMVSVEMELNELKGRRDAGDDSQSQPRQPPPGPR